MRLVVIALAPLLVALLAVAAACGGAPSYDIVGHVSDDAGRGIANIEVACALVVLQKGDVETLDDVDFSASISARTGLDGAYACSDVPTELFLPDPWPGADPRDMALRFLDDDGEDNGGAFREARAFALRVGLEETRTVDVTLAR